MKRFLIAALLSGLTLPMAVIAAEVEDVHKMQTGEALMRMCFGAITVKSLSIMCHNYINGYLDAVAAGQRKGKICFKTGDPERLPPESIVWLKAHPDYMQRPAPEVLDKVLLEKFACRKM
jgi:hypothetical protein